MTRPQILPFTDDDIEQAGALLARRHAAHRVAVPALAGRFETADEAVGQVLELWKTPGASGAVARSAGRAVGYLLGAPRPGGWGPNVWVPAAGHAVEQAETVRDLYGLAAARWVEEGQTMHYALVPASDGALVDAWFRLGFGQQHVHALGPAEQPAAIPTDGFEIRRACADDLGALAELEIVLSEHQSRSPVFSTYPVPTLAEAFADWAADFDDPARATFVAERGAAIVGSAGGCPVERSTVHIGLACPESAGLFTFAAVRPDARGAGIGSALGRAVLGWIAGAGYRTAVTDWRATNLLSSRAWPRLGYRASFLRLNRVVG